METQTIALIGAAVYLLLTLGIGLAASRRVHTADDFIVAGRNLPVWLCTATMTATWMGAGTIMGAGGAAYEGGFLAVIADPFGGALCLFLAGAFYMRTLRRIGLLTIVEFFEIRFDRASGFLASIAMVLQYIGWTGTQLVAFGYVLQSLTGFSTTAAIVIGTAIVLFYTTLGGMWAVVVTDFVQMIILMTGLVVSSR